MIPALTPPLCHPPGRFVRIPTVIRVWSLLQDPELSIRKITLVEEAGLYQISDCLMQYSRMKSLHRNNHGFRELQELQSVDPLLRSKSLWAVCILK